MNDRPHELPAAAPFPHAENSPGAALDAELGELSPGSGLPLHPALNSAREDDVYEIEPPRRWLVFPAALFLCTCGSTFWAAASNWMPAEVLFGSLNAGSLQGVRQSIVDHWPAGLTYMGCVLAILFAHEMGHFLTSLYYRVPASLPFFIPVPISPIGTMGAVIGMDGMQANRRQLFDIGIAGPLAGLVLAVPILWIGVQQLPTTPLPQGAFALGLSPLIQIFLAFSRPEILAHGGPLVVTSSQLNPYFMAGWVGLFVTGINMMPLSQLDGGHVLYGLTPRRARSIARAFLLFAIAYSVMAGVWHHWAVMLLLITILGVDHPPTANDRMSLGWPRTVLGLLAWLIPVLCFPVNAISVGGG